MKLWLSISVVLNLALLIAAGVLKRSQPEQPIGAERCLAHAEREPIVVVTNPPSVVYATNRFDWLALESTNYKTFMANLRAVECPEQTIRDIILADARRQWARLKTLTPQAEPFWLAGRARAELYRERQLARQAEVDESLQEVRRLFDLESLEASDDIVDDLDGQALARFVVMPDSEEQLEQVAAWFESAEEPRKRIEARCKGIWLEEDERELRLQMDDKLRALERIFSPAHFAEFKLRVGLISAIFDSKLFDLEHLEFTSTELRQATALKIKHFGWIENLVLGNGPNKDDDFETLKVAFFADLKTALRPEHYAEYMRLQDNEYRQVLSFVEQQDLSRDTARKLYEIKHLAFDEIRQQRSDPKRAAAVADMELLAVVTEASVRDLLGQQAYEEYLRRGGQWVTNFAKP